MKNITKIISLIIIAIIITLAGESTIYAVDCPDTEDWICNSTSVIGRCSNLTDNCNFHYEYCYTVEDGILKVFIADYGWGSCVCVDEIQTLILKAFFNKGEVQEALGVDQAGTYSGVEIYTKNCVKFIVSNTGPDTYNVVGCEGSTCCQHIYNITYVSACPPGVPCSQYNVSAITTTSSSYIDDNCETLEYPNVPLNTCYPACEDWAVTVTFPPSMAKISLNEEEITVGENYETLYQKLSSNYIEEISIINLNGEILYKSSLINKNEINLILKSLNSGTYFYSYKKDGIFYTGKLLIIR